MDDVVGVEDEAFRPSPDRDVKCSAGLLRSEV